MNLGIASGVFGDRGADGSWPMAEDAVSRQTSKRWLESFIRLPQYFLVDGILWPRKRAQGRISRISAFTISYQHCIGPRDFFNALFHHETESVLDVATTIYIKIIPATREQLPTALLGGEMRPHLHHSPAQRKGALYRTPAAPMTYAKYIGPSRQKQDAQDDNSFWATAAMRGGERFGEPGQSELFGAIWPRLLERTECVRPYMTPPTQRKARCVGHPSTHH